LFLVLGEVHHQTKSQPTQNPCWLVIPERGLYTGICAIGATGSTKTKALILPAMRQLFAYQAHDPEYKLSGVVLEVKGDFCRQLRQILTDCGRTQDYIEVPLDGPVRYNPLNNSLDPCAQACNIVRHHRHGDALPMRLIHDKLIVGDQLRSVPGDTSTVRLQQDVANERRRLRLKPETGVRNLDLDLRNPNGLRHPLPLRCFPIQGVDVLGAEVANEEGRIVGG